MSESNTILVDIKNAVATITLNRPAKRNAMSPTLHLEMAATLEKLRYEKTSRVLVITGAGEFILRRHGPQGGVPRAEGSARPTTTRSSASPPNGAVGRCATFRSRPSR